MERNEIIRRIEKIDGDISFHLGKYLTQTVRRKFNSETTKDLDLLIKDTIELATIGAAILKLKSQRNTLTNKLK